MYGIHCGGNQPAITKNINKRKSGKPHDMRCGDDMRARTEKKRTYIRYGKSKKSGNLPVGRSESLHTAWIRARGRKLTLKSKRPTGQGPQGQRMTMTSGAEHQPIQSASLSLDFPQVATPLTAFPFRIRIRVRIDPRLRLPRPPPLITLTHLLPRKRTPDRCGGRHVHVPALPSGSKHVRLRRMYMHAAHLMQMRRARPAPCRTGYGPDGRPAAVRARAPDRCWRWGKRGRGGAGARVRCGRRRAGARDAGVAVCGCAVVWVWVWVCGG
jgi:hypothetical protein